MRGLHLTADLHDCRCDMRWLADAQSLGALCLEAVAASGLRAVGQLFHAFPATAGGPGGVTVAVLLAESHLCLHTWPELRGVTLDVYVCNIRDDHSAAARALMARLAARFDPARVERHAMTRGAIGEGAARPTPPCARG
jgi:S-adenosylmethionine decarboxylase